MVHLKPDSKIEFQKVPKTDIFVTDNTSVPSYSQVNSLGVSLAAPNSTLSFQAHINNLHISISAIFTVDTLPLLPHWHFGPDPCHPPHWFYFPIINQYIISNRFGTWLSV